MKFILGSIPNGAGTMVLWFLWSLIVGATASQPPVSRFIQTSMQPFAQVV